MPNPNEAPVTTPTPTPTPTPAATPAPAATLIPPVATTPNTPAAPAGTPAAAVTPPGTPIVAPPETTPPVVYALTLSKDAVIPTDAIERTTAFAKAAGLSPDAAQQVLDLANKEVVAYRDQQVAAFEKTSRTDWVAEIQNDPELGGANLPKTQLALKLAADRFLTPSDREALNASGMGNNPMLVRMFARIGKAMNDDGFVNGGSGSDGRDTTFEGRASRMYPTTHAK